MTAAGRTLLDKIWARHAIIERDDGIDELDFTLGHRADIEAFERTHGATTPWL